MFSLFEKVIISLFCFLLSISVDAQKLNLNVHVVDARNGESLPYVNVYALTSNKGTISNHEGKFAIAADSDEMIRIGFVGYEMVNLKASQMPKTVRLVPCNILLDEVQVTANEYILLQVSKDLKAQLKKHASKKCQFFMRMLTTCMNKEQTEVFATANSVGNINNLSIVTGNHSRKMNEGENPMISYMTLHRYFELGPWAERTTLRRKPICPLKPDLTIEYLQKHYNIRNEVFEDKDGNRYRRLTLQRLPSVTAPILTGELYLDATTNKMLRFLGQLENSEISFDLVNVFNFAPSKCKIHINYKNSKKGVTEISNVAVQVSSGDIHSQGIMFNIDDMKLNLKSSNLEFETSNDIVSTVRNVGYNQKLWNTTNIVKRTDEEERLMNSPNQNTIANNIPLLDIRFSKDEWNEIYHLDSRADNRLKDMVSRLARFTRSFPQEKVYLHMDNTNYFIGDTIWYAAYTRTTSNNHPSALSGTLYVELYNQDGYMMERQTIEMRNGRGWGNFALKKDYYGGFYELRAYTRWQLNWGLHERDDKALGTDFFCDEKLRSNYYRDYDKLYSRVFPVYDAVANVDTPTQKKMTLRALQHEMPEEHRTPSLALYPEGGNLVDGVPCRVAYEALWSDGEQMQLADRPSRGTIEVTPELGKEQVITFSDVNNNEVKAVLPQPVSKGVALRAQQTDASWNFHLVLSPSLCKDSIAVTIMHQGMLEKAYSIGGTKCSIRVGKAELQEGVNQITVFDVNGCVLADRLFFNTVDQRFKRISVTQNAQSASPQENVESISFKPYSPIKLIVTSEPKSIISMAVHDAAACDEIADNATLRAEMLLSSEVKGFIPNPNYYFERDDEEHRQALDLLMMIQGWRRFVWRDMAVQNTMKLTQLRERTPIIDGQVCRNPQSFGVQDGSVPDVALFLEIKSASDHLLTNTIKTNENKFSFRIPSEYGAFRVMISAADTTHWSRAKFRFYDPFVTLPIPDFGKPLDEKEYVKPSAYLAYIDNPYPRFVKPYNYYQQRIIVDSSFFSPKIERPILSKFSDTHPAIVVEAQEGRNHALDAGMKSSSFEDIVRSYFGIKPDIAKQKGIELRYGIHSKTVKEDNLSYPLAHTYSRYDFNSLVRRKANGTVCDNFTEEELWAYEEPSSHEVYAIYSDYLPRQPRSTATNTSIVVYPYYFNWKIYLYRDRDVTVQGYKKPDVFYRPNYSRMKLDEAPVDYRRTIYWNPCLQLDSKGKATVSFYNNATQSNISISAEGMTADGTILEY